ncbi:Hypothetical predicted protein [Mytilus galloprovincialis]|uniref:Caspase recruitment domain-containing protein n=1 Tax=Mytilus galloprovincialis TaxID=29158 RepID=A0A8B6G0J4_MYTGA|nr:Hypothetical predicted protein [Mytilus galloprovincialis]
MSLQSQEKASKGATNQHGKNLQDTELTDDLLYRVLSLEQDFIQFLKPSDVMYDIQGLDDLIIDQIMETESNNRERAVTDFMKEILKNADMVTQFVFVLEKKGYKRFIDPINLTFPDKGTTFCQEYFEFIIKRLKGELIDVLDTLKICGNLYQNGCLELRDKEEIEAVHLRSGRTASCKRLFQIVRRRKANWAFLFIAAIKESQEYVKCKMDPSSTNVMASLMSLQSQEKASKGATNQHGKNLQDTELTDDLLYRVLSLEQDFIQFLKPSDVMYDIQGLDDLIIDQIMETESNNRERAVTDFMKEILKNADMVTQFVFVLEKKGYKRFIDPINLTFPDKGTTFCQEYFEFIIKRLKGELIDVLDTLKICGNLYQNGCLELRDKEEIEAVHLRSGRTASCKRLFQIVRRRKANWAFLFIAAIKASQEYVKCKMDPSSTNENFERAGVLVDGNSGNPYTSEITEAFRDITRWTAVSGENEQSDDKRNTIEKIVWKKFEIDCSITNLFACHCVFMGNQIVFCDRNVFLVHN